MNQAAHARSGGIVALLLALQWACAGGVFSSSVEVSSTAFIYYNNDFVPVQGNNESQCNLLLRRARDAGGARRVNLVLTSYFIDGRSLTPGLVSGRCDPKAWLQPTTLTYLCAKWSWDSPCEPFYEGTVYLLNAGLQACLQQALRMFDSVMVTPQLDDGTRTFKDRALLSFDPLARDRYNWSYYDAVLHPVANAVATACSFPNVRNKTVWFSMQGAMASTLFHAPDSWAQIARNLTALLQRLPGCNVSVGVQLPQLHAAGVVNTVNGSQAPGTGAPPGGGAAAGNESLVAGPANASQSTIASGGDVLQEYTYLPLSAWPNGTRLLQSAPAVERLLRQVGFIGVASYPIVPRTQVISDHDMEQSIWQVAGELGALNISLASIVQGGTPLLLSDVGLGGGGSPCGDRPAASPQQAAAWPWWGVFDSYTPQTDPWAPPAMAAFRERWYAALLEQLRQGGVTWPLQAAFLHSIVSYDPQGIHTASNSEQGSYASPTIVAAIRHHNAQVYGDSGDAAAAAALAAAGNATLLPWIGAGSEGSVGLEVPTERRVLPVPVVQG